MRAPNLNRAVRRGPTNRTARLVGVALALAVTASVVVPQYVHAAFLGDFVFGIVSETLQIVISFLGGLLVAMIHVLISVVQYNDFLKAPAVERGWVVVRDVGNMFFIVVLIIIAFGSILRIQGYRYNQWLFRIVLMALLVNFSKTIAGFFIDVAQVIMLTFVSAFKDTAAGNFAQLFGITKLLSLRDNSSSTGNATTTIVVTELLAVAFLTVALAVTVVYVVIFLLRIVAIWFLVALSPMAYVLNTFKQGERYAKQWWENFGKYLVMGPVLAFFLWLALTITAVGTQSNLGQQIEQTASQADTQESVGAIAGSAAASGVNLGISEVGSSTNILNFIAGIVILVGALGVVSKMGVAGGQLAASARTRLGAAGARFARSPVVQTSLGLATGGAAGLALAMYGASRTQVGRRYRRDATDRVLGGAGNLVTGISRGIPGTTRQGPLGAVARGVQRGVNAVTGMVAGPAATNLAILRGRQFTKRVAEEDAVKKDFKNLTDNELGGISRTQPLGELGRSRRKAAVEEIITRKSYDAAGYNTPEEKKDLAKLYENLSYLEKRPGKKTLADGQEVDWEYRTPRDKASADFLKTLYESNPTFDPDYAQFKKYGKGSEYFAKKGNEQLSKLDSSAANDDALVRDLVDHLNQNLNKKQRADFERKINPAILKAMRRDPAYVQDRGEDDLDLEDYARTPRAPGSPPSVGKAPDEQKKPPIVDAYGRPYEPPSQGESGTKESEPKPAGRARPADGAPSESRRPEREVQVGDEVHWESQGVNQWEKPKKVTSINADPTGQRYAFVEGSNTGIPIDQLRSTQQRPTPGSGGATAFRAGEPPYRFEERDKVLGDLGKNVASLSRAAQQVADSVSALRSNTTQIVGEPQRLESSMDRLLQEVSLQRQKSGSPATQAMLTSVEQQLANLKERSSKPTTPVEAQDIRRSLQEIAASFQARPPGSPPQA
jgi:hypothetical protein